MRSVIVSHDSLFDEDEEVEELEAAPSVEPVIEEPVVEEPKKAISETINDNTTTVTRDKKRGPLYAYRTRKINKDQLGTD